MSKQRGKVPAYVRKINYLHRLGLVPRVGVAHLDVYHDDWCRHLAGTGSCNCAPEVKVRWSVDEARKN